MVTQRNATIAEAAASALERTGEAHVREIARRVNHSAAAVGRALARMEESGTVTSRWVGRSRVYRLRYHPVQATTPADTAGAARRLTSEIFDPDRRPYFLWDLDMSWSEFADQLRSTDQGTRRWAMERLLNDGRWIDIWKLVTPAEVAPELPYLRTRFKEVYQAVIDAAQR